MYVVVQFAIVWVSTAGSLKEFFLNTFSVKQEIVGLHTYTLLANKLISDKLLWSGELYTLYGTAVTFILLCRLFK